VAANFLRFVVAKGAGLPNRSEDARLSPRWRTRLGAARGRSAVASLEDAAGAAKGRSAVASLEDAAGRR